MTSDLKLYAVPHSEAIPESAHPLRRRSLSLKILLWGTFSLLCFGPLAFGAVERWSILVIELGSAVLYCLVLLRDPPHAFSMRWRSLSTPLSLFAALIMIQLTLATSAYRYVTLVVLLFYSALCLIFWLVGYLASFETSQVALGIAFSIFGITLAVFALLQDAISPHKIYGLVEPPYSAYVFGPYVNHSHYAGLMEMLFPLPLIIGLNRTFPPWARVSMVLGALVMLVSICISQSRGGIIAAGCQLVVVGIMLARDRNFRHSLLLLASVLLGTAVLIWIFRAPNLSGRIASLFDPLSVNVLGFRRMVFWDSTRMIVSRPLLGWGLGTFSLVFPAFKTFRATVLVNAAHNDYLQLMVETGSAGFLCLVWFLWRYAALSLKHCHRFTVNRRNAISTAAFVGTMGIAVHSFADFNMQIPANAAFFFALCALSVRKSDRALAGE